MLYTMVVSLFILILILRDAIDKFINREGFGVDYKWAGKETDKYC